MKEKLIQNRQVLMYLFFGVCTTLVNIIVYRVCSHGMNMPVTASTVIAWILSVLFAYITNRKWVFESRAAGLSEITKELVSFFAARLSTGLLDLAIMFVFAQKMQLNDMAVKIVSNVIVIILNYVLSKLVVFREK